MHFAIDQQLKNLPRKELTEKALENSKMILVKDVEEAIAFSNAYAPEHLILQTRNAEELAEKVINAGSVFIGHYTPESVEIMQVAPIIPCQRMVLPMLTVVFRWIVS